MSVTYSLKHIYDLNARTVGRRACAFANDQKRKVRSRPVVQLSPQPKWLLSLVCVAQPQMICCLLMLSGLVKNHFEGSHSQVNLCTFIHSVLYEIQKNTALLFPSRPQVHLSSLNQFFITDY